MSIASTIQENSIDIKLNYARLLHDYLVRVQPHNRQALDNFMKRVDDAQTSSASIAKYALDNVVNSMQAMLENATSIEEQPSTSRPTEPTPPLPSTPMSTSSAASTKTPMDDNDYDSEGVARNMIELKNILAGLLASNTLQSLTKRSLIALNQTVGDSSLMYEDYFKNGIELDKIDCDINDALQNFIKIFEKYGPVRCVITDVQFYAERVRANPQTLESLSPSVRAAVVTILDLVERKSAYTEQLTINPIEFNAVTDETVKALLNRYSEHRPIQFNVVVPMSVDINRDESAPASVVVGEHVESVGERTETGRAVNGGGGVISTDEEEQAMTQTMRRKRKMRTPAASMAKTPRRTPLPGVGAGDAADATNISDDAFIDNVKQMHKSNIIVPQLIMQIVNVVPVEVSSSLLTCPTNGLSEVKISANNYNSTIALIKKMNLTVITENVYFYKLLEPLAYYGSSEALTTKVLWFIARAANYFTNNARNFNYLRNSLRSQTDDVDRVALFMIRYNFLWFYRQFLAELLSSPTTPYQSQRIINVLHVYASVVQKEYNKLRYDFNQSRVYVGPVDNVVKLMVVSMSDILA
ncbi:P87 [Agrotis segetum nucleopolyhedrovirus A]|uniref:p87 n=1 Tax=Agrotis segetum nuclear polyhedrosis virus TaxID=1962501 RepID=Q287K4_NPVAS|nr:P87 [Agrotis segetum nucleopolyhedrovirus A]AAZ38234.1 P87 [Agrotis segetum nucleopolyhedrovirus A]